MHGEIPNLAAIRFRKGESVEMILDSAVRILRNQGIRMAGYLQRDELRKGFATPITFLENIANGHKKQISQMLGSGATGCKLDPDALLKISQKLEMEIDRNPDLLIINRFGRGEAEGHGLRPAIEKAFARDIPVLVAVRDEYLEDWRNFSDDCAIDLSANCDAVITWFRLVNERRSVQLALV